MKTRLLILLLLVSAACYAQPPGGSYTPISQRYNWLAGYFRGLHVPAGPAPTLQSGQWSGAGAVYVDTTGGGLGFHYYLGGTWHRLVDSSELSSLVIPVNIYNSDGVLTGNRLVNGNNNSLVFDSTSYTGFSTKVASGNYSTLDIQSPGSLLRTIGSGGTTISEIGTFAGNPFADGTTNGISLRIDNGAASSRLDISERYIKLNTDSVAFTDYGDGTHIGTAAYTLQVDANGNVIEGSGAIGVGPVANGIKKSVDTLLIGDSLDRYTYLQVRSNLINNSSFNNLTMGNLPEAQSLNGIVGNHPLMNTYNPSTLGIQRIYSTANGDIDSVFYGGALSTITRILRDSTDIYFKAGVRSEYLAGQGGEFVYQYFPPRDSMVLRVGRDGQSGNVIFGQLDIGHSWGYNMNIVPPTDMPLFPISAARTSIDLARVIDNTRRKKIVGAGVSGVTTMYKTYQNAINMSTYEAGNYTESIFGLRAYGDAYPLISGATKAKTLAVWEVNKAYGFYADPQYRYTNTVRDGYAFVARGDSDYSHLPFLNIGPYSTLPTRSGLGNSSFADRLYVTGNIRATGNSYSFVSEAYGMAVSIPVAIGTEAGISFGQKDSIVTGNMGTYLSPSDRTARGLYIRSEMFNGATMDNNSIGGYVQIETGVNHLNVTRWFRNGNMVVNWVSAVTDQYRLYKKFLVNGNTYIMDSLQVGNLPTAVVDTTVYKPAWVDANGNFYRGAHAFAGGGGGGITIGTTTITGASNTNILYNNSGVVGQYTLTGSGTAVAMGTSPVFTTDITTPIVQGGSSSGGNMTLKSTTNATKGKILFGTSAYDEVNNRLGIATASPAYTLDVNGTAMAAAFQTTSVGENGNFLTGATTGMRGATLTPFLFPGGAGTDFRVSVNGTTSSTSTAGRDIADLVLTGSVTTEAGSSTHPRAGTLFVGSKIMTNGAGATDTLYGAYFNGPATGVTPVTGSWNTIFNLGNVLVKYGKLVVGVGAASAGVGSSFISTVTPGSGADAGIIATGGAITEFSSGNHTTLAGLYLSAPTITGGSATVTKATTLYVDAAPSATVSDRVYAMFVNAGEVRFNASASYATAGLSGTTTLDNTYFTVRGDATSASFSVNLPAAAGCTGRIYVVKKVDASGNTVTIDGNASETIDGATTKVISTQYAGYRIQSNGTGWDVIGVF